MFGLSARRRGARKMDPQKRTQLEKGLVLGLLVVLAFFVIRALNQFGVPIKFPFVVPGAPPGLGRSVSVVQQAITSTLQSPPQMASATVTAEHNDGQLSAAVDMPLYTAQSLRDPMKSLLPDPQAPPPLPPSSPSSPTKEIPFPALAIQGLLWGGPTPSVIINNEVYTIGQSVQGVMIKTISREGVTVEFQGHVRQLESM